MSSTFEITHDRDFLQHFLTNWRTKIEQLFACTTPQFTPDGKPTLIVLGNERIETLFGK